MKTAPIPASGQRGFTLIEIAIVLVIIGAVFYGVLRSQSILSSAKAKDVISKINDLRTATTYFRQRYGYYPGDLPAPGTLITTVPPLVAGSGGKVGNGSIEGKVTVAGIATAGSEAAQAPWQLYNAGFIGAVDSASPTHYLNTNYGPIQLVASATADALAPGFAANNPSARNAILFFNLPCDIALEVDTKLDDGVLTTGFILGSAACTNTNLLPVLAVPL